MKSIKRILTFVLIFAMCLNFGVIDSKAAASVSIALSASTVSIGGGVSATVSVSGSDISAYDIYVSYDASVLQFNSGSGSAQVNGGGGTVRLVGTGAGSTTLSFTAVGNGSCYISTSGSECYDINYNQISISHAGASVTVATASNNDNNNNSQNNNQNNDNTEQQTTEQDDRSSNCNLKSLQISPGTLEPAFSPSTTSYFVQVDEDVTSMVVSAVAEDDKATTEVRGAGLIEPGANTVTVTVTAENGAVKVYTLSVAAGEVLGDAKTVINGIEYSFIQNSKGLESPEGYSETTSTYKDWEVLAFESPNKKIILVCLKQEDGEEEKDVEWFIYDKENESFTPYREYSSEFNRYVITEAPEGVEIPDGFEKTKLDIGGIGEKVIVYRSDDIKDRNIYLVYAVNIAGDEGFYWYDAKEKAFLRYAEKEVKEQKVETATETVATPAEPEIIEKTEPKDEGFFTKKILGIISIGLAVIAFIFLVIIITLGVMLKSKAEDEDDEQEDNQLHEADDTAGYTNEVKNNPDSDAVMTENMAYEEERRAYEEDRETVDSALNIDLAQMNEGSDTLPVTEDRNIKIMSFAKKEKPEAPETEVKDTEDSEKETSEKETSETEVSKPEIDNGEKHETDDGMSDAGQEKEAENNDEIATIKFEFPKDYDAEKDSAFTDESDK